MSRLKAVKARKLRRALEALGYELARIQGSHHIFVHPATGRRTTLALHAGDEIPKGTVRQILEDIGLTWKDLEELL